ncbi:Actin-2 [Boothiomyces sp. JEL0866]|nr:Actin-2 [Boothiomyces sp. JEL0866]
MTYESVITNQPVGSGNMKAGFAGEDQPKCYFHSIVGKPKHYRAMAGATEGEFFVGNKAQELRGLLSINYPMEHGIVTDWNDMEKLWQHVYSEELKILSEEHPVLLTEAPLNPQANRDKMAQIFFETFNVPALYISIQAILSLYASGKTTGIVLDVGDGVTHTVPVCDGFAIPQAIRRMDIAGRDVTEQLQILLRKQGVNLFSTAEFEVCRIIKEKKCFVALNPTKEDFSNPDVYTLPDGKVINLGAERSRAPEILFSPHLIGVESPGVHQLVLDSINRVDMDLRKDLYSSVVLSGGTTVTKGFADRMLNELKKVTPKNNTIKAANWQAGAAGFDSVQIANDLADYYAILNNALASYQTAVKNC